jgi:hypothetical protein
MSRFLPSFPVCFRFAAVPAFAALLLAGCATAPAPAPKTVVAPAPAPVAKETEYSNMVVSDVKGVSSPFVTQPGTIFPENKMGYRLVLTSDVSMPNLVATELSPTEILVQARVYNRSKETQVLDITFAVGEDRESYHAPSVVFPGQRARDIKFKLSTQATQNLRLIVSRSK